MACGVSWQLSSLVGSATPSSTHERHGAGRSLSRCQVPIRRRNWRLWSAPELASEAFALVPRRILSPSSPSSMSPRALLHLCGDAVFNSTGPGGGRNHTHTVVGVAMPSPLQSARSTFSSSPAASGTWSLLGGVCTLSHALTMRHASLVAGIFDAALVLVLY